MISSVCKLQFTSEWLRCDTSRSHCQTFLDANFKPLWSFSPCLAQCGIASASNLWLDSPLSRFISSNKSFSLILNTFCFPVAMAAQQCLWGTQPQLCSLTALFSAGFAGHCICLWTSFTLSSKSKSTSLFCCCCCCCLFVFVVCHFSPPYTWGDPISDWEHISTDHTTRHTLQMFSEPFCPSWRVLWAPCQITGTGLDDLSLDVWCLSRGSLEEMRRQKKKSWEDLSAV